MSADFRQVEFQINQRLEQREPNSEQILILYWRGINLGVVIYVL